MNTTRIHKKSLDIKNRIQKLEDRNLILDDSKMLDARIKTVPVKWKN